MKTFSRSILFLLMAFLVGNAYAQQPQRMSAEDRAKSLTEWMTKELALDDKTSEKVQELNLKYAKKQQKKMEEARESGDRSKVREEMGKINDEKNKHLKPVLGDEKYEQYLKLMEERRQNRGGGQGGGNQK